jgi:hypothetical protein
VDAAIASRAERSVPSLVISRGPPSPVAVLWPCYPCFTMEA